MPVASLQQTINHLLLLSYWGHRSDFIYYVLGYMSTFISITGRNDAQKNCSQDAIGLPMHYWRKKKSQLRKKKMLLTSAETAES